MRFIFRVIIYCHALHCAFLFVSRLPCKYYANFGIIIEGKYLKGNIMDEISPITQTLCLVRCLAKDGCIIVNYNSIDMKCELISSFVGAKIARNGGRIFEPFPYNKRGETCALKNPCQGRYTFCFDTCNSDGYICKDMQNVALGALLSMKNEARPASLAIDENVLNTDITKCAKSATIADNFFKMDLKQIYFIDFIDFFPLKNYPLDDYKMEISTDDNDYVIAGKLDGIDGPTWIKVHANARYVAIQNGGNRAMMVCELGVYILPD